MNSREEQANAHLSELFARWKAEHRQLNIDLVDMCQWMNQKSRHLFSSVDKVAARLSQLRGQLQRHFESEENLGYLLAKARGSVTQEIDAVCRRVNRDHETLTARLDAIIGRFSAMDIGAEHWAEIVYDFNLFIDALEQHEEEEESSVSWLRPLPPASSPQGERAN